MTIKTLWDALNEEQRKQLLIAIYGKHGEYFSKFDFADLPWGFQNRLERLASVIDLSK